MFPTQTYTVAKSTWIQTHYTLSGNRILQHKPFKLCYYVLPTPTSLRRLTVALSLHVLARQSARLWKAKPLISNVTSHTVGVISELRKEPATIRQLTATIWIHLNSNKAFEKVEEHKREVERFWTNKICLPEKYRFHFLVWNGLPISFRMNQFLCCAISLF